METHNELVNQFHNHLTKDPSTCVYAGLDKNLGKLPNVSKDYQKKDLEEAKTLINQFESAITSEKDFEKSLDLKLASLHLKHKVNQNERGFNGALEKEQVPTVGKTLGGLPFTHFINDPRDEKIRIENITSLLKDAPTFINTSFENLKSPVERWKNMELSKISGLPSLFNTILNWVESSSPSQFNELKLAIENTQKSLKDYENNLAKKESHPHFHLDEEQTKDIMKKRGINISPQELHEITINFLTEAKNVISDTSKNIISKYNLDSNSTTEDIQNYLYKKHRVERPNNTKKDDFQFLLDRYEKENIDILNFIKKDNLFPILKDQSINIIQTPGFMVPSIPAGAMMPPAPFREGIKNSMVYLTLSEELLDEHTEISIPVMMVHEGIPGHHLQFSWAATNSSIVRKHIHANDYSEGWTTWLEDYFLDIGYKSEVSDECRFQTKRDLSRLSARVAIDLYFMSGNKNYLDLGEHSKGLEFNSDCPFANAKKLLVHLTGFTSARADGELNWYSQERGYPLSYLTGNYLVKNLRKKFKEKNKELAQIKSDQVFNNEFLKAGNMPLSFLYELFKHKDLI